MLQSFACNDSKPGLIQSFFTRRGCPMATTTISAFRTTSRRFLVFEWQTVTVAWFQIKSWAIGEPTILLRPTTTALAPAIWTPASLISFRQPFGVHGRKLEVPSISPWRSLPALTFERLNIRRRYIYTIGTGLMLTHPHPCAVRPNWLFYWHQLVCLNQKATEQWFREFLYRDSIPRVYELTWKLIN